MENEAGRPGLPLDVVIGLGANLGDREAALRASVRELARFGELVGLSALYRTLPVGGPPQPDFLNAAARLRFGGPPEALLAEALGIERRAGRERLTRWGPRRLDLDILWIRGVRVVTADLIVPHPRLRERAFALRPLADVAPDAVDPVDGVVYGDLLAGLGEEGIECLGAGWAGAIEAQVPRGMDSPCA